MTETESNARRDFLRRAAGAAAILPLAGLGAQVGQVGGDGAGAEDREFDHLEPRQGRTSVGHGDSLEGSGSLPAYRLQSSTAAATRSSRKRVSHQVIWSCLARRKKSWMSYSSVKPTPPQTC